MLASPTTKRDAAAIPNARAKNKKKVSRGPRQYFKKNSIATNEAIATAPARTDENEAFIPNPRSFHRAGSPLRRARPPSARGGEGRRADGSGRARAGCC